MLFWLSGLVNMLVIDKYIAANGNTLSFLSRRFVRLSPTWWLSIAFVMLVGSGAALRQGLPLPIPGAFELFCNLLYIPRVAGSDVIGGVAWTLCIEFQLYLLFAISITVIHKMSRDRRMRDFLMAVWIVTSSLVCFYVAPNVIRTTWFVQHWPWFGLGITSCLTIGRRIPRWMSAVMVAIIAIGQYRLENSSFAAIQFATLVAIAILSFQKLDKPIWQRGTSIKWLGDISYPYFLFHMQFNLHAHYLAGITDRLELPIITVYIATVLLPLLLAIAITPLMNRIDRFLMAKLFFRPLGKA
jgi:peptidoglycan/LPS O-acetylase OafA/YrhL